MAEYEEAYGLIKEMWREQEELAKDHPAVLELTRESLWTTRDKKLIAIKDMTDSHLLNTIRVLDWRSPHGTTFKTTDTRRRQWIQAMSNEAHRRRLMLL